MTTPPAGASAERVAPYIVIVTGWRGALFEHHRDLIAADLAAIRDAHADVVLRHGRCPYGGVDLIAAVLAHDWGWTVEEYPPEIVNGRILGPGRNRAMCAAEPRADEVVAFPGPGSRGTWDCLRWAVRYGIPFRGVGLVSRTVRAGDQS